MLGGFAFASAGTLLAALGEARSRAGSTAIACAVLSACCFILCALSWTLSSVRAGSLAAVGRELAPKLIFIHSWMSLVFELGILTLFVSLGASGWVHSRRLGLFTSGVAVVAALVAAVVMWQFFV